MDEHTILDQLEELIERFGVKIRHDAIQEDENSVRGGGGLCLLRGEYVLILNAKATIRDRIWTLGIALKQFDYEKVYLRPVLREFLERIPDQRRLDTNDEPGPEI